jgi:transcriptional regulator with XRE-family HTH domain
MINGKGLKKLRTYKGYHQKEIADALDVCQQYISKLENSKKMIEEVKFQKIKKAMEISDAEWDRIKEMFTPPRKMSNK